MKRTLKITVLAALLTAPTAARAQAEDPTDAGESTPVDAEDEFDDEQADDILQVVALPLATDELRATDLEEEDIQEALEGADAVGLSAGETAEFLLAEAETNRRRGKKRGFGAFVKRLLADGYRGRQLRMKIRERKDDTAPLSDDERARVQKRLDEARGEELERRRRRHDVIKRQRAAGQPIQIRGERRHQQLRAMRTRHGDGDHRGDHRGERHGDGDHGGERRDGDHRGERHGDGDHRGEARGDAHRGERPHADRRGDRKGDPKALKRQGPRGVG